ncbi:hypothetical protein HR12_30910 [Microbacterium sp. SUBG005]|nr:hypothetical protein HR12_30910 [Microbacterium sp. SUBG005]
MKLISLSKTGTPVIESLKVDLEPIRKGCRSTNFYGAGYAKYLLLRAEIISSELTEPRKFAIRSVEHVLPQNPATGSQWRSNFTQEQIDALVHTSGNLVLLSKSKNSSAQNKDFDQKKLSYLKPRVTDFPRSVQVLSEKNWTRQLIERRTKIFAATVLNDP